MFQLLFDCSLLLFSFVLLMTLGQKFYFPARPLMPSSSNLFSMFPCTEIHVSEWCSTRGWLIEIISLCYSQIKIFMTASAILNYESGTEWVNQFVWLFNTNQEVNSCSRLSCSRVVSDTIYGNLFVARIGRLYQLFDWLLRWQSVFDKYRCRFNYSSAFWFKHVGLQWSRVKV